MAGEPLFRIYLRFLAWDPCAHQDYRRWRRRTRHNALHAQNAHSWIRTRLAGCNCETYSFSEPGQDSFFFWSMISKMVTWKIDHLVGQWYERVKGRSRTSRDGPGVFEWARARQRIPNALAQRMQITHVLILDVCASIVLECETRMRGSCRSCRFGIEIWGSVFCRTWAMSQAFCFRASRSHNNGSLHISRSLWILWDADADGIAFPSMIELVFASDFYFNGSSLLLFTLFSVDLVYEYPLI